MHQLLNTHFEDAYLGQIVAGIDEVGRGALCGPVVCAAVILPPDFALNHSTLASSIKDSKAIAKKKHLGIYGALRESGALIGLGAASAGMVDEINVLQATMIAMIRATSRLAVRPDILLIDGNKAPATIYKTVTVIGGDRLCMSIAAASICAKVVRDQMMKRLALRHPDYGWDRNSGYGTTLHYAGIQAKGLTRHHRRSFVKNTQ